MTASHSCSVILHSVRSRRMPALLIRPCRAPKCSTAASIMRLAPAKSATFSWLAMAWPPAATISLATASAVLSSVSSPERETLRSLTTTRAPSRASCNAYSRPMPRPAPVTMTTRPSHSLDMDFLQMGVGSVLPPAGNGGGRTLEYRRAFFHEGAHGFLVVGAVGAFHMARAFTVEHFGQFQHEGVVQVGLDVRDGRLRTRGQAAGNAGDFALQLLGAEHFIQQPQLQRLGRRQHRRAQAQLARLGGADNARQEIMAAKIAGQA